MVDSIIPSSCSLRLPCPRLFGAPVKIHLTLFLFVIIEFAASLRFVSSFPLYCVLVVVLCGPIWTASVLVHEWGHLWMSRRLLPGDNGIHNIVLWPLGGYEFCDGLSRANNRSQEDEEDAGTTRSRRGTLKDDMKIALAGPLMHIPMGLLWFALYAAINDGKVSGFTFRIYLPFLSDSWHGFFSTLFEQSCLIQVLLLWFNLFLPVYPVDGGRLITSSMLTMGVALNKAALITFFVSILVSIVLFVWSIANFVDGPSGIIGILAVLVPFFIWAECYRLYSSIVAGRLRSHPLFGRDCYIYRDARPSIFQMSSAARNIAGDTEEGDRELDESANENTMVATESDDDRITQGTGID